MELIKQFQKSKSLSARLCAVQGVYASLMGGEFDQKIFDEVEKLSPDTRLFKKIKDGALAFQSDLNSLVDHVSKTEETDSFLRAILMCAFFEKTHLGKPVGVLVTEYKLISNLFYGNGKAAFIQAVLNQ